MMSRTSVAVAAALLVPGVMSMSGPAVGAAHPSPVVARTADTQTTVGVWEWRRLDDQSRPDLLAGLAGAASVGATHMTIDLTYLVDISEIADPTERAALDTDLRHRLADYTAAAAARGLSVAAVVGTPGWADPDTGYVAGIVTGWVRDYNRQRPPRQRLTAIEIDVEPWVTPRWRRAAPAELNSMMVGWLRFIQRMRTEQRKLPPADRLPLRVDVPMWLDGSGNPASVTYRGRTAPATDHVFRLLDTPGTARNAVVVMAYRDTVTGANGSAAGVADEFALAARRAGRVDVVIGQETAVVPGDPEYVTFFAEGRSALLAAMTDLTDRYSDRPGFAGFSIGHAQQLTAWLP